MKKADKLNLAFGKCFNKSHLTKEECDLILDVNLLELMSKHGFNEIQSREILLWCQSECQRKSNNYLLDTREDTSTPDLTNYRT